MPGQLQGTRVAALVAKGFEEIELVEPRAALEAEGAVVHVVSPELQWVRGWNHTDWGAEVAVDRSTDEVRADEYDALLLPGGVMSPDHLRMNPAAVRFVKACFDAGMPIAVICHGAWTLIEAGVVRGALMTSYPSLRTDLINAGADWIDEAVVVDRGIVSSRDPGDIPSFTRAAIDAFAKGKYHFAPYRQIVGVPS